MSSGAGISDDAITTINPLIVADLGTVDLVFALPEFPRESAELRRHLARADTRVLDVEVDRDVAARGDGEELL